MKNNIEEMEKIFKLALNLNVDTFGIVDLYPIKRSSEAEEVSVSQKYETFQRLSKIYEEKKPRKLRIGLLIPPAMIPQPLKEVEYGCGYVCSFPSLLGINANGDVAPCDGLLNFKQFILGNIRKKSLKNIWNHSLMKKLRGIKKNDLRGVCKKCKHLSFCMGGCRARAFIEYGNFQAPNPLCQSFYDKNLFPMKNIKPYLS
jgi:radical SAM protein with 4Fe4S-binding SPASM domain